MSRWRPGFDWLGALLAIAAIVHLPRPARGHEPDLLVGFFQQLRERQLFGVAERFGLDRRAELPRESAESIQLAAELSRTYAAHAMWASSPDEHTFLVGQARDVLSDYEGTEPWPRIEAVTFERVARDVDAATAAWWTAVADGSDEAARRTVIAAGSAARAALDQWIETTARRSASPAAPDQNALTRRELARMLHEARQMNVELVLSAAELEGSATRREALLREAQAAIEAFRKSTERGTTARFKLFSMRIARLSGDENQLRQLHRQIMTDSAWLQVRADAVAEVVRFELDRNRPTAAAQTLVESLPDVGGATDRLKALHVEAVLGLAAAAGSQRSNLMKKAEAELGEVTGPWRVRAEVALMRIQYEDLYGTDAAPHAIRAERELRARRRESAIAAYRAGAEAAESATGRTRLHFIAASLLVQLTRFEEALSECQKALRDGAGVDVENASLLAVYCRGRLAAAGSASHNWRSYEQSILEHLERFPEHATTGDAALMLAALGEQTDRPSLVIHAQTRLPSSHPQSSELIRRSAAAVLKAMDDLRVNGGAIADGRSVEEWSRDAARLAEALLAHTNDSASQVTAARLLASSTAPDHRRVLSILQRVENAASRVGPATDEQTTLLQQTAALRLVSHVALGEYPEAAAILERVHSVSTDQLLGILTQLRDAGRQLKGAPRTELAQLELAAITRIRLSGQKLNDEQQQLLIECEAEALFATDRFEEAARLFGEAFRRHPALRSRWAESLERTGRKADLERAVAVWRELEAEQRQGTIPWFEMRLRHARSLMLSERRTEARKLIASTRLVYQELGSADLARRYQEVEDQASGNSR